MLADTPLFRRVLGASFDKLPTRIRECMTEVNVSWCKVNAK